MHHVPFFGKKQPKIQIHEHFKCETHPLLVCLGFLSIFPLANHKISAQLQEFTGMGQLSHLGDGHLFSGAVEVFNQGGVRAQGGAREHNSQNEQLQAHPHPPWTEQEQMCSLQAGFITLLGKSLLEVPSCKAFSSP